MMVLQQKNVNYSEIHAIMIAAYTVYKIVTATINFIKTRKSNHLSVKILRNINFVDALVSILSLQMFAIIQFKTVLERHKTIDSVTIQLCILRFLSSASPIIFFTTNVIC